VASPFFGQAKKNELALRAKSILNQTLCFESISGSVEHSLIQPISRACHLPTLCFALLGE